MEREGCPLQLLGPKGHVHLGVLGSLLGCGKGSFREAWSIPSSAAPLLSPPLALPWATISAAWYLGPTMATAYAEDGARGEAPAARASTLGGFVAMKIVGGGAQKGA